MTAIEDHARSIFLAALERVPDQWHAFLDEACGDNAELRARVDQLLHSHQAMGSIHGGGVEKPAATIDEPIRERPGTVIGPYKLLEQIGEGGFGVVFMAEQTLPVRRKVALKVLKPGMDTRQVVARFEAERQALALMDHANIARVLEAGETSSGRPYFVMELVRGASITDYCDHHHLSVRERLDLFVAVCQAVQHAHQKGIIHRDIKPSNVLVTLHDGKPVVKVIDFGIAKAMGQQLTDKTLFTNFAQMIGTPLYMSPEQAEMSGLDADTRSDIYSLGVLLYELLTGTTPFDKERLKQAGFDEIRRIIREEEPPKPSTRMSTLDQAATTASEKRQSDPRKLSRLFRGELDWIVMKALEKDRNRRYETASAFAADVGRYLKDEAVLACPPSVGYRFRKFARRNKTGLGVAGLALFFLVVLGSGIGWTIGDRAARRTSAAKRFDDSLAQAAGYMQAENWPEAKAAAQRAADLLNGTGGDSVLEERLRQVEADLDMVVKLELARLLQITEVKDGSYDRIRSDLAYAEAFRDYNLPVKDLEPDEAARRIDASAIREQLLAALGNWANSLTSKMDPALYQKLAGVIRLADSDPWRRQLYDLLDRKDVAGLVRLSQQPAALTQPSAPLVEFGNTLALTDLPAAVNFLRQAQQRHPDDFWINHQLAFFLCDMKPQQLDEAIGFCRAAVALRRHSPGVHYNLGLILKDKGQLDEAIAEFQQAIHIKKDFAEAHCELGSALANNGQLEESIAEYREAIRLKRDFANAHSNLGNALRDNGQLDEAIAECREAIRLKKDSFEAHGNLGLALLDNGQLDEAIAECRESIRIKRDNANAHNGLGVAFRKKCQLDEAIAEFREAIRLKKHYAIAHCNLGAALYDKGRLDDAITEYREAIRLKKDFADAHANLGNVLREKGQLDEAIAKCQEAIRLKKDFAEAHWSLALALQAKGRLEEAIAEYRKAIRLKNDYAELHYSFGRALHGKGELDEAIAEYRQAIRLKKDFAEAHCDLGIAFEAKDWLDEAIAEYKESIRLKKDYAEPHYGLGRALHGKGQLDEAIAEYREAICLKKDYAEAHCMLGLALDDKGDADEAMAAYREAIRLKKDYAEAHNFLGLALHSKGQLDEAIAEHREAIRLRKDFASAHNNLGLALRDKGQLDEAVAEYREAIRLKKDLALAHLGLGKALVVQGHFQQAVEHLRLGNKLGARYPHWPSTAAEDLRQAERMADLDPRLPKILKGEDRPADAGECMAVAQLCQQPCKQLNAAAARFYAEAFASEPKLTEDMGAWHRYNAACAAALAGCGKGKDAGELDDKERARLRRQSLTWLRADLAEWRKQFEGDEAKFRAVVQQTMQRWLEDTDFAGVRSPQALKNLPEAERQDWQKLWADVKELCAKAGDKSSPQEK